MMGNIKMQLKTTETAIAHFLIIFFSTILEKSITPKIQTIPPIIIITAVTLWIVFDMPYQNWDKRPNTISSNPFNLCPPFYSMIGEY